MMDWISIAQQLLIVACVLFIYDVATGPV